MKKSVCLLGVLILLLAGMINSAEAESKSSMEQSVNVYQTYCDAYTNYIDAKYATELKERNILYAQAINDINQSLQLDSENSKALLLASQIYRSKGANGFAKQYFMRAEQAMLKRLEQEPNSIEYNLDYAIACYAGDVRFWNTYVEYEAKAKKYAESALVLCVVEEPIDSSENLLYMAMANLILGHQEQCKALLLIANENKQYQDILDDTDRIEFYCRLYENTVSQKQWIWEVREASVNKEFLLHYLADFNWNK